MRFDSVTMLPGGLPRWLRRGVCIAAVVVLTMVPTLARPGAVHPAAATGGPLQTFAVARNGYVHTMLTVAQAQAAAAPTTSICGSRCNFLPYGADGGGGGPLMHTSTIYAIYWLPGGYNYGANSDANYENLINQFFGDLSGTAYYNILTQYPDKTGPLVDNTTFGGSYVDTTAYPCGSNCGDTSTPGHFLTDSDIQTEVLRATAANSWSPGRSTLYMVFTGNGVQSCASFGCSHTSFCAYHGNFFDSGHEWLYANMYDAGTDSNCKGGVGSPNGDATADAEINPTSHEMSEAITDPEPNNAWTDFTINGPSGFAGEIGDLCAYVFNGNTTLNNGHQYSLQEEWSNFDGDCVHGDTIYTSLQYTGPTSANPGDTVTLAATFQDNNGNGVGEQTINFTLGSQSCSGTSDFAVPGTSLGRASCTITLNQNPGSYTVTAQYNGGLGAYQPSSTSVPFSINQKATNLTYTGATTGDYNDAATVSAQLTDATTSQGISNEKLSFTLNNSESCTGMTDSNGNASCTITPLDNAGQAYAVSVSFAGDAAYKASNASGSLAVNQEDTAIAYNTTVGALSGDYNDSVTLAATLTDPTDNTPIANKTVTLGFGLQSCNGLTNSSGAASCQVTAQDKAGTYQITASFGGDSNYKAATDTAQTFTVNLEQSTLTSTSNTLLLATGQPATLSATLLEDGNPLTPIVGRTVKMTLGSGGLFCTGTTNSSGVASCQVTPPASMQGPQTITDSFASDGYYQSASHTQHALTFTYIRGAFALGDVTVKNATTVTWWGSQWYKLNSLSGGTAPSALKGFGATMYNNGQLVSNGQVACGDTFTTSGGNSSNPPATVPAYMAVAVSGHVTMAGSTISGDIPQIVIVKTNPGYAPDPSNPGTGSIVATLCP